MTDYADAIARFDAAIAEAKGGEAAFAALQALTQRTVGAKLFTYMTVDMENEVARRAYTSDPVSYRRRGPSRSATIPGSISCTRNAGISWRTRSAISPRCFRIMS